MFRFALLGVFLVMTFACSSESEKPTTDIKVPLGSIDIVQLERDLRIFGSDNGLVTLENDSDQMRALNDGTPALSFWFYINENSKSAINVTTVNEGNFMRVMIFSGGFESQDQMYRIQELFFEKFEIRL